jgi:lipase chaperone LimK
MGRDAYLDRRAYKTLDFLEELVGNLSREQRQKIREMSRRLPVVRDIYIEQRETNQVRLIKLLSDNAGADRIASFMSRWILTPEATRTAQQQRDILAFETASDEMIANIQAMLTTKQKSHLDKKISFYIDELQNLTTDTKTANDSSR